MTFKLLSLFFCHYFFSFASLPAGVDVDGWAAVGRPDRVLEEKLEQEDVWVVFSKEMKKEKFFIRFPKDPVNRILGDSLIFEAFQGEDLFRLEVLPKILGEEKEFFFQQRTREFEQQPGAIVVRQEIEGTSAPDLFCWSEGKWVQERVFETSEYIYVFHTQSDHLLQETRQVFIDSFDAHSLR